MGYRNRNYVYYQPNDLDLKDEFYDDPIRALTKLLDMSWVEVFDELVPIARKMQCSPLEKCCYERYLYESGFVYKGISNKNGSTRPSVESFARNNRHGKYLLNLANHCVAVVDGKHYNIWDAGQKSLYGVWASKEDIEHMNSRCNPVEKYEALVY